MTPPGKSAALRVSSRAETGDTGAAGFEAAVRNAAAARLRPRPTNGDGDKLLSFPSIDPARAAAAPEPAPDFGGELEAALMSDLQSMVAQFDEVARAPAETAPASPLARSSRDIAEPSRPAEPDQEALDRLLASIRQADRAPRRAASPLPDHSFDEPSFVRGNDIEGGEDAQPRIETAALAESEVSRARSIEPPKPKRNPDSPRPSGHGDRLASPSPRARKPVASPAASPAVAPRIGSMAEPVPALQLAIPGARRAYVKPAIAATLLILLAAVGATMTIRALTARNDAAPSTTAAAVPEGAGSVAEAGAKLDDQSAAAAASPEPTTIAKAETQPMTATVEPEPARVASDNAAQHAIPPEMTQPTVIQVTPPPAPTVPLQPAVTQSEPPAADMAAADPAPAIPANAVTEAGSPKPAAAGNLTAGSFKPGPGRIVSGVKLRTNPDNGAPVIGVLGQGTNVQIVSCKGWCEVVAGDKRGFVYQKFLATVGG